MLIYKGYQRVLFGSKERGCSFVGSHLGGRRKVGYFLRWLWTEYLSSFRCHSRCEDGYLAPRGCRLLRFDDAAGRKFGKI